MKNFYVALYKAEFKNKGFNKIKTLAILKVFEKLEKETQVKFIEDLS